MSEDEIAAEKRRCCRKEIQKLWRREKREKAAVVAMIEAERAAIMEAMTK